MSTTRLPVSASTNARPAIEKPYFEQQREVLLNEIGTSFEHVLQNINKLNRSLEGAIAVGNEFGSVEALWSQFEHVMAKDPDTDAQARVEDDTKAEEGQTAEDAGNEDAVRQRR